MKIRFAAGAIFNDIYTALGANPLQMSFADLQPALSSGAVDGQENPVNLFLAFRMDALAQRHMTIWNYVNDALIFGVSKSIWNSFTPTDQALIRECAQEAARNNIALARRGLGIPGTDDSALVELRNRNVEVTTLTLPEKRVFADALRPVYDRWANTVGSDLVRKAETAIRAVS
jgi:TRAP-type C4-dicarboxylate transport system substrate-binding protein